MFQRSFLRINKIGPCRRFAQQCEASGQLIADYLTGTDKGIVSIGFNNNKTKNALGKALTESLNRFVNEISNNSSARVVIFRSMIPKVFCAGADLKERRTMSDPEVKSYVTYLRNLMLKIESIHIPTIAAIDGAALGGGLELALSCDIRIASESAKLGLVETRLGILPGAGGTQRLPRLLGASVAKELIFTSRILNGKESKELSLVNHCVPNNNDSNAAYMKSLEIAREILANGPIAIQLAKMAISKGLEVDINQGCAIEELCYAQVIPTKDRLEGLKAFQEKRKPVYIGE